MEQDQNFTVLENKSIGRNISMYRKIKGFKAAEVAEKLGMKESSYTRYERGEGPITVDLIQQVAEVLAVDPLMLLSVNPSIFIEIGQNNGSNSPIGIHGYYNHQTTNDQQLQAITKVLENILLISEKLLNQLDKKK